MEEAEGAPRVEMVEGRVSGAATPRRAMWFLVGGEEEDGAEQKDYGEKVDDNDFFFCGGR